MKPKLIAAAVSIIALAMPATAMAAGGGGGSHTRLGSSGSTAHGATAQISAVILAVGSGYDRQGGSPVVRTLQLRLAAAGFGPGPVDGLYGPRTQAAVRRLQAATGLPADGVAGPRTLADLSSRTRSLYPGAGYGSGGSRVVRDLQRLLARAGYDPGRIDGLYGPLTEHAVRLFQAAHHLLVDGIARPQAFIDLSRQIPAERHAHPPAPHPARHPTTTHPATVHPPAASPQPAHTPAPVTAGPTRSPSVAPWLVILAAALGVGLLLAVAEFARRRRRRVAPSSSPTPRATEPAADHGADADNAFRLGVVSEEQNDLAAAEAAYRRADLQGHAAAASNLGLLLERRGDLAGASAAYHRANERGDRGGAFNLAMLLEERGEPAAAEVAYRRADLLGHAAAASNLGVLLERRGDVAGAEAAYRRADERGDPNGSFNIAVLLEERGDPAAAEAAYRRADQRGPAEVANAARAALLSLGARPGGAHAGNGSGLNAG